ncbi:MAG TPA: hypothetical protein VHM19_16755 [Polyangiales bacterium]|nr:hypothetical protein [Polyangiales bacterium]
MTELSPESRRLIELTRDADGPLPADRARMDARLALVLGAGALGTNVAAGSTAQATSSGGTLLGSAKLAWLAGALALTAAVVGVGLLQHTSPRGGTPSAVARAPVPAPRAAPVEPPVAVVPPPTAAAPSGPQALPTPPKPVAAQPRIARAAKPTTAQAASPTNDLSRELALLAAARDALRGGDASKALASLAQHEHDFPNGTLREERLATQALASCTLQRYAEGRAYLGALLQSAPSSPLIARVRSACQEPER